MNVEQFAHFARSQIAQRMNIEVVRYHDFDGNAPPGVGVMVFEIEGSDQLKIVQTVSDVIVCMQQQNVRPLRCVEYVEPHWHDRTNTVHTKFVLEVN